MEQGNAGINKKLIDNLLSDLRALSNESKRKCPPVKEAAEGCMLKVRNLSARSHNISEALMNCSEEILRPFILGAETKILKIVQICMIGVQRMVTHKAVTEESAALIVNMLWSLMMACMEELKLLQTTLILLTTTDIVRGKTLAKAIVLCCRLHFSKDVTISNTAAATIRQAAAVIFDRVISEDTSSASADRAESADVIPPSPVHGCKDPPPNLQPSAADAFMFFRDLCQLGNADSPYWLEGINEIPRTFGLELMESVLNGYSQVFLKHQPFLFLLKERVCPLVIKLFSPSIKYKLGSNNSATSSPPTVIEKPNFPVCLRLLRVVYILINQYYSVLVTECEIFLSLVVKFLDADKPMWQRALAVEVVHKLCIQPKLIKSFCQNYDMKMHSTKVFQEIVNSVSTFVQSMFASNPATTALTALTNVAGVVPSNTVGQVTVGENVSSQPAFNYRNIWIPIIFLPQSGVAKTVYVEMLDKTDIPIIQDGYALTVSFGCLLDIVKCISMVVTAERNEQSRRAEASSSGSTPPTQTTSTAVSKPVTEGLPLWRELITSSWCGVLAAFSLLLDASTDETATELILKSDEVYISLCGVLDLSTPRDAFVTSLCKASLPPYYAITILNSHNIQTKGHSRKLSTDVLSTPEDGVSRGQGAATGTPPPLSSQSSHDKSVVMLTVKNLQCMSAILSVAHCHGGILGTSWHLVLTTLQHLVWMLGMRPSTGGSLKATEAPTSIVSAAAASELPLLSSMLSRLFESSQYLDDVALHHLIDALCKLSTSAMESARLSKEPSLFAVAKLLETGLVNLIRVDVFWKPVTAHLLEVCQHSHVKLREWGAEGVTALVKASLSYDYTPPLTENQKLQAMLLSPLQDLSAITHSDIRQRQLECVLMILQERGYNLGHGWPLVLNVIGHVTDQQGESLIRLAFQSLQLVVTDFLHMMKCSCLQLCVEVAAKFSLQNQELNISLTSIGLLWNISDYIYQNRDRIKQELEQEVSEAGDPDSTTGVGGSKVTPPDLTGGSKMPPSDLLWMCLYSKLGDRCVDERPAVRKSAGQTLFSTITAHGSVLDRATWHTVLWQVLFPLLERVKKLSSTAANERNSSGSGNILMHHSRDTAEKQWAETRVLTLAGVARVFNSRRNILQQLGDFPRAWALLLEYIEYAALSRNNEVSLNALKSFQEILQLQHRTGSDAQETDEEVALWANAWRVWYSIGVGSTSPPDKPSEVFIPAQPFLTALVQIFPMLFDRIKPRFVAADLQKLATVLRGAVSVPIQTDISPYIVPCMTEAVLTSLQDSVLGAINTLEKEMCGGSDSLKAMYPALFDQLLTFVTYACQPPRFGKYDMKLIEPPGSTRNSHAEWIVMNYVPFAEKSLDTVVHLYTQTARHQAVIEQHVLQNTIRTLRLPLGMKYGCPSATTWKLTVNSLMDVLNTGLAVASEHSTDSHFNGMWTELGLAFEEFLFSKHPPPPTLSLDEHKRDEALDTQIITMIRQQILPQAKVIPQPFVAKIMNLLNKGSIHSATSATFTDADPSKKLREDFARSCFETLLQFSFITKNSESEEGAITKLALTALLKRCQDVLKKYVEDERLSGKCPLPRPRMSEIAFVLKAVSTLMMSLKSADLENIDVSVWQQVINLYPYLVDCTMCSSSQVCKALKEALHQYLELLSPPLSQTPSPHNHLTNGQ